jgi:ribosomal protein S18 acetylase RimI-like enzyme
MQMIQTFYSIDNYPFNEDKVLDNLMKLCGDPYLGRIWKIMLDNVLVGYIVLTFGFSLEYNGRDAFVDELFIKKGVRNRGIGNAAMLFLESQAKALHIKALHLEVEKHNKNAYHLYSKLGFADNNRRLLTKIIIT